MFLLCTKTLRMYVYAKKILILSHRQQDLQYRTVIQTVPDRFLVINKLGIIILIIDDHFCFRFAIFSPGANVWFICRSLLFLLFAEERLEKSRCEEH